MQQSPTETKTRWKGHYRVCAVDKIGSVCVCDREREWKIERERESCRKIKHNRYFQMTCRCPQRTGHYLIATVWPGLLIGHTATSQETDTEDKPSGPTTTHAHQHSDVSLHWGGKAISKYTHTRHINTDTYKHTHKPGE